MADHLTKIVTMTEGAPEKRLAAAVIVQAIRDTRDQSAAVRREARVWLATKSINWLEIIAPSHLDPQELQRLLLRRAGIRG